MYAISKKVYVDKLADRVNEYNIHIIKPLEDPKLEVGDHVRISKLKTFLQKITFQTGLKSFCD